MIYLPACFVIILLIVFQIINGGVTPPDITAYMINQYGECYRLQPIMCIGGSYAEINMLESELKTHYDIPNIAEIRYENEEYIIKNMEKDCKLTIKRGTRWIPVKPDCEMILRNQDSVRVIFGNYSITYEFTRG